MRVLLTGSNGFLGRHILKSSAGEGVHFIRALRENIADTEDALGLGTRPWGKQEFALALAHSRADVVLHCGGVTQASQARVYFEANVFPALGLLEALADMISPPRVILIGSAAEYGVIDPDWLPVQEDHPCRPRSLYGIAKHAQTLAGISAAERGLPILVARLFNPIGKGMASHLALPSFARRIASADQHNGILKVGDLTVERDFIAVEEAARLLLDLARMPSWPCSVVNICSGQAYRIGDLLEVMVAFSEASVRIVTDPNLLRPGDMPRLVGSTKTITSLGIIPEIPEIGDIVASVYMDALASILSESSV